jgi:hypothetical protein
MVNISRRVGLQVVDIGEARSRSDKDVNSSKMNWQRMSGLRRVFNWRSDMASGTCSCILVVEEYREYHEFGAVRRGAEVEENGEEGVHGECHLSFPVPQG